MKKKSQIIALLLIGSIIILSYSFDRNNASGSETVVSEDIVAKCERGLPLKGKFYPNEYEIGFYKGPGKDFDRVINIRASEALGKTDYRTLTPDYELEGLCQDGEWIYARISGADGNSVNWESGWVEKKYLNADMTADQKIGLRWDIQQQADFSEAEKKLAREGALKVLKDESNCAYITTGYRSSSKQGAYYVTCEAKSGLPFNVWFTPEDIKTSKLLNVPAAYPETSSRKLCYDAINSNVAHASTLNIHDILGYATEVGNNGNRTIIQEFSSKNAFGLELKYQARCLIMPDGEFEIHISEIN